MKFFYTFLLVLIGFCFCDRAIAQQTSDSTVIRAQTVYVELLGQGILLSLNYDTRFANKRNGIGGRIGIGYIEVGDSHAATVPIGLNYLLGKGRSFFEIGLGATYLSAKLSGKDFFTGNNNDATGSTVIGTMSFSYRLQPIKSGFSFRGGITPIFGSSYFFPYYGISLGYTF